MPSGQAKAMLRARREILRRNDEVRRKERERKRRMKVEPVSMETKIASSPAYKRYRTRRLGKFGAASPVRIIMKDGKLVEGKRR
jgi:hypothetical protein